MGGIYSFTAMKLTKAKDPWFTMLLAFGLSITVSGIGLAFFSSYRQIIIAVIAANTLLLIRRCFGKFNHNAERFGLVHALTLVGCFWYVLLTK